MLPLPHRLPKLRTRHNAVDRASGIGYHEAMIRAHVVRRLLLTLILTGCSTLTIRQVPFDERLASRYGHAKDITARPYEAPRNIQWEEERLQARLRVGQYLTDHPSTPPAMADALRELTVVPGMTKAQIQLLWGPPDDARNVPPKRWRRRLTPHDDLWQYRFAGGGSGGIYWLYFREGILEDITTP